MAKPKLTDWFPAEARPTLPGAYQRDYRKSKKGDRDIGVTYSYWNGYYWSLFGGTPVIAKNWQGYKSAHQSLPWRGLAEQPKDPK
jgi:hypothetical protein